MKAIYLPTFIYTLLFSLLQIVLLQNHAWAQNDAETNEAPATPIVEPPVKRASFTTKNNPELLAKGLDAEQVMWLTVNQQQVLTLYNAENSGKARGGVILLPHHQNSLGPNSLLNNLQQTLAINHWHSLTITMPLLTTDSETRAQQHIEAAIQFFNDRGIYNMVLLGEGSGANRALNYISTITDAKRMKQIRGLAMINAVNNVPNNPFDTVALIPKLKLPMLDIYFDNNPQYPANAKKRLRSSRALPRGQYQQIKMPRMISQRNTNEDRLTKRIRGWLERTASGFSVGVKP